MFSLCPKVHRIYHSGHRWALVLQDRIGRSSDPTTRSPTASLEFGEVLFDMRYQIFHVWHHLVVTVEAPTQIAVIAHQRDPESHLLKERDLGIHRLQPGAQHIKRHLRTGNIGHDGVDRSQKSHVHPTKARWCR